MRYGNPMKKAKVVASTKGHAIEFPGKGSVAASDLPPPDPKFPERATIVDKATSIVYVYVPAAVQAEVAAQGLMPESEIEEVDAKAPVKPETPDALKAQVDEAFEILVAAAERDSFSGNGTPKPEALEKLLGYKLTKTELNDLWGKYMLERGAK